MMNTIDLIATCAFGLEGILKNELINLGFDNLKVQNGRVEYKGNLESIAKSNIWLRTADRVLVKISEFYAESFEDLYEGTKACPWEQWIPVKGKFPVAKATSVKSKLFSKSDCQKIVKKAVVDRMTCKYGISWFDEDEEIYPIYVNILNNKTTLSIDTSGTGLHKRGYRAHGNEAPLKETLAAAIIYISKWKPERLLADPLCGSGTILIEAAMIGKNIAPGLQRDFISQEWDVMSKQIWKNERESAESLVNNNTFRLLGSDIDSRSLKQARLNCNIAGLNDLVSFQKLDVDEFKSRKKFGVIITNPPYGERLSSKKEVERLYNNMGSVFNKLDNWSYFILTSHLQFERYFGRKATKNRKLYNGTILTYLYQYFGALPPKNQKF